MDFSSLLSGLAEEVKRKPNKKPDVLPLPSEQAIGEVVGGAEQELAAQASEPSQGAPMQGSPLGLGEQQLRATEQGIADEPANADNVYQTVDTSKVDGLARVEGANRPDMSQLIPLTDEDRTAMTAPIEAPVADRTPRKLSLDEQIAQREQAVRDATDAPIEKQSLWKDLGAKLIQGADAFFNGNRAPIQGWGRLKHDQAIQNANAKLNPLLAQRKQINEQLEAQQKSQMGALDYQLKTMDGAQKAFNNDPDVMIIKQSNRVTPDQAARLNKKYGTSYTPSFWGKFVSEERGGKSYIRPEDKPNFVENTSLPIDRPKTDVAVPLSGGGFGYTTSKDAVSNDKDERVAGITANRQVAIKNADLRSETEQRNTDRLNKYASDVVSISNARATKLAELGDTVGSEEIKALTREIEAANARYSQTNDEADAKIVNDRSEKLAKLYDKQSKNMAVSSALSQFKMPTKPKLEKVTQVDMGNKKIATPTMLQRYMKTHKVSKAQAIKDAEADGYTIQ